MKKARFALIPILLICVMMFGAWSNVDNVDVRYADAPLLSTYASETISYTRREVDQVTTAGRCPTFWSLAGMYNACGPVAGTEIVAYYDKYYPELISDWVSYFPSSGKYRGQDSTYVPAVMNELYTLMRTNVDDVGVSQSDFLNGLSTYVTSRGYNISYQSVKSGQTVNYAQCKTAIDNNKVIVLLAKPTTVYSVLSSTGSDTVTATNISGAHIMVAFGYYQLTYYNANGAFRTDTYLYVAMGQPAFDIALYKVGSSDLNGAYIINIG